MSSIPYSRYLIYPIPWYSFLIVTGVALAVLMAWREEKKALLPKDTVIDLALWLLPSGIIGARIYYVVFSWSQFRDDLLSVFRIWEGGIAIYGGVIGGLIALILFSRRRQISALLLCDVIAPGLALAQSIGRWGNWFNIEAYGLTVTETSLCFFPFAVQVPSDGYAWHLATFFYESVWDLAVFVSLIMLKRRPHRRKGDVFFFYLLLYAAGRLVIEELRTDSLYTGSTVRVSQLLSVVICIFVLVRYSHFFLNHDSRLGKASFLLLFLSGTASVLAVLYTLFSSALATWPTGQIIIFLSLYSLLMITTLILLRFHFFREVCDADD